MLHQHASADGVMHSFLQDAVVRAVIGLQGSEVQPCAVQRQVLSGWRRASDLLDPDDMLASCPASIEERDGVASLRPLSFREPCAATPAGCRVRLARAVTPSTLPANFIL